jgi:hypothetical protein
MMLIGFAGLGYAARKQRRSSSPAKMSGLVAKTKHKAV